MLMANNKLFRLSVWVALFCFPLLTSARDSTATRKAFEEAMRLAEAMNADTAAQPGFAKDGDLMKRANEYNFMHHQRSFTWQYYSGIVIFFLVVAIVAMGLVLSYQQFKLNERLVSPKKIDVTSTVAQTTADALKPAEVFTTSTMEISKDGLKINTAVIGLIILSLSIAFFFLYLKYVYPITFVE